MWILKAPQNKSQEIYKISKYPVWSCSFFRNNRFHSTKTNSTAKAVIGEALVWLLGQEEHTQYYVRGWCCVCLMKQINRILAYPLHLKHVLNYGREGVTIAIGNLASMVKSYTLHNLEFLQNDIARICAYDPHCFLVWIKPNVKNHKGL
jgi:hypothetical protein